MPSCSTEKKSSGSLCCGSSLSWHSESLAERVHAVTLYDQQRSRAEHRRLSTSNWNPRAQLMLLFGLRHRRWAQQQHRHHHH